jgi:hypothetical protein
MIGICQEKIYYRLLFATDNTKIYCNLYKYFILMDNVKDYI